MFLEIDFLKKLKFLKEIGVFSLLYYIVYIYGYFV